ncbi:MAG: hypothetical protein SCALA702_36140 [Melioribacteraceae bacterium]|nr:MAG: hypothetical protein SCALA702_36140 [Melioribacteraceae bacterium]
MHSIYLIATVLIVLPFNREKDAPEAHRFRRGKFNFMLFPGVRVPHPPMMLIDLLL